MRVPIFQTCDDDIWLPYLPASVPIYANVQYKEPIQIELENIHRTVVSNKEPLRDVVSPPPCTECVATPTFRPLALTTIMDTTTSLTTVTNTKRTNSFNDSIMGHPSNKSCTNRRLNSSVHSGRANSSEAVPIPVQHSTSEKPPRPVSVASFPIVIQTEDSEKRLLQAKPIIIAHNNNTTQNNNKRKSQVDPVATNPVLNFEKYRISELKNQLTGQKGFNVHHAPPKKSHTFNENEAPSHKDASKRIVLNSANTNNEPTSDYDNTTTTEVLHFHKPVVRTASNINTNSSLPKAMPRRPPKEFLTSEASRNEMFKKDLAQLFTRPKPNAEVSNSTNFNPASRVTNASPTMKSLPDYNEALKRVTPEQSVYKPSVTSNSNAKFQEARNSLTKAYNPLPNLHTQSSFKSLLNTDGTTSKTYYRANDLNNRPKQDRRPHSRGQLHLDGKDEAAYNNQTYQRANDVYTSQKEAIERLHHGMAAVVPHKPVATHHTSRSQEHSPRNRNSVEQSPRSLGSNPSITYNPTSSKFGSAPMQSSVSAKNTHRPIPIQINIEPSTKPTAPRRPSPTIVTTKIVTNSSTVTTTAVEHVNMKRTPSPIDSKLINSWTGGINQNNGQNVNNVSTNTIKINREEEPTESEPNRRVAGVQSPMLSNWKSTSNIVDKQTLAANARKNVEERNQMLQDMRSESRLNSIDQKENDVGVLHYQYQVDAALAQTDNGKVQHHSFKMSRHLDTGDYSESRADDESTAPFGARRTGKLMDAVQNAVAAATSDDEDPMEHQAKETERNYYPTDSQQRHERNNAYNKVAASNINMAFIEANDLRVVSNNTGSPAHKNSVQRTRRRLELETETYASSSSATLSSSSVSPNFEDQRRSPLKVAHSFSSQPAIILNPQQGRESAQGRAVTGLTPVVVKAVPFTHQQQDTSKFARVNRPPTRLNNYDSETQTLNTVSDAPPQRPTGQMQKSHTPQVPAEESLVISDMSEGIFSELEFGHRTSTPNTNKPRRRPHRSDIEKIQIQIKNLEKMYHEIMKIVSHDRLISDKQMSEANNTLSQSQSSLVNISSISQFSRENSGRKRSPYAQHHYQQHHQRSSSQRVFQNDENDSEANTSHLKHRFSRLESQLTILAKSVAQISQELKSIQTIEEVIYTLMKEVQELKQHHQLAAYSSGEVGGGSGAEVYRSTSEPNIIGGMTRTGFAPMDSVDREPYSSNSSYTNPKKLQKLTKFFGQEPPLLRLFLQKLNYENFAKNFEKEHITITELPYLSEEKLKSLNIPLGPRLRILQEAQLAIRQDNLHR